MSNKFLGAGSTSSSSSSLTDGTTAILVGSVNASNLEPSTPLRTSATKTIVSSKLNISDTLHLQSVLDGKMAVTNGNEGEIPFYNNNNGLQTTTALRYSNSVLETNKMNSTDLVQIYRSGSTGHRRDCNLQLTGNNNEDQVLVYGEYTHNHSTTNDDTLRFKIDVNDYFGRVQTYDWSNVVRTCITSDDPTRAGIGSFLRTLTVGLNYTHTSSDVLHIQGNAYITGQFSSSVNAGSNEFINAFKVGNIDLGQQQPVIINKEVYANNDSNSYGFSQLNTGRTYLNCKTGTSITMFEGGATPLCHFDTTAIWMYRPVKVNNTLMANSCNIQAGQSYLIDGVALNTSHIPETATALYYTDSKVQGVINSDTSLVRTTGNQTVQGEKVFDSACSFKGLVVENSDVGGGEPIVFLHHPTGDCLLSIRSGYNSGGSYGEAYIRFENTHSATHGWNCGMNDGNEFEIGYSDYASGANWGSNSAIIIQPSHNVVFNKSISSETLTLRPVAGQGEPSIDIEAMAGNDASIRIYGAEAYVQYQNSYTGSYEWRMGLNDSNNLHIWYGLQSSQNDTHNPSGYLPDIVEFRPAQGIGIGGVANGYPLKIWSRSSDSFSIYATYSYATDNGFYSTTGGWMSSDARIKDNIEDVPDSMALQMVRDIPCRYYTYKDTDNRGVEKTIGFIAQEVEEVLPMAVEKKRGFLPDIYTTVDGSWSDTTFTPHQSFENGVKYRFRCGEVVEEVECTEGSFKFEQQHDTVFCYGREIDDFHVLNKDKIFTLHHSAIQEMDALIGRLTDRIKALEARVGVL